ncbi:nesprin-1-like [Megalops cyprinoides]|uniref:nesprin-1-like n=1 Tax=Megalops cyprinoides TaxID=118141 RepID=UPI00186408D2|nr:nesprin-1-like [Megalops cyprinoides]
MESAAFQNGDISIEEMIEKLHRDVQEEMMVAQENRLHLQRVGERLAQVSPGREAPETQHTPSTDRRRWQELLEVTGARMNKLQETLSAVQQLDRGMSSLRSWLAHMETELSRPVTYHTCDSHEIQRKLSQQEELERDIEDHRAAVASVLSLCDVLLQDCDVCATDSEYDSVRHATRSLDQRWRSICATASERRRRIEETRSQWQRFLEEFSRFADWLKTSERVVPLPDSSGVLYTTAKEELKKFEALERQVQEKVAHLDLINKQYRHLKREHRTDASRQLQNMVHDGNQRWEDLQKRVDSVLRRLKCFIIQREEFEMARDAIQIWVTEMDLQLTNTEYFSACDVEDKVKLLEAFQEEISLNRGEIEHLRHQGELLMENSEPPDVAVIEEELEELHRCCEGVFGRVERYYRKLTGLLLREDEHDLSDPEVDLEEAGDLSDLVGSEGASLLSPPPSTWTERLGQDSPVSMGSIPLEWDHGYDLSLGLRGVAWTLVYEQGDLPHDQGEQGSPVKLTEKPLNTCYYRLLHIEGDLETPEPDPSHTGHMNVVGNLREEDEGSEKGEDCSGFVCPTSTETETAGGVMEPLEPTPTQAPSGEHCTEHSLHQWQQFNPDLHSVREWLKRAEAELEQGRGLSLSVDAHSVDLHIRKLKGILEELVEWQQRVALLQGLSQQLPAAGEGSDSLEAEEKVYAISTRLTGLLGEVSRDIERLERMVDIARKQESQDECKLTQHRPDVSCHHHRSSGGSGTSSLKSEVGHWVEQRAGQRAGHGPFLRRVLWTALPIQLLLLLLIVTAATLPPAKEDHSYALADILVRYFHLVLHYVNGPPPT